MRKVIALLIGVVVALCSVVLLESIQPGSIKAFIAEQSKVLPRIQGEEILKSSITKKKICKKLGANIRQNYRRLGVPNPVYGSVPLAASIENYESLAVYFKCRKALHTILMDAEQELSAREFK